MGAWLIALLTAHASAGADTRWPAYYNPLMLGATDLENLHIRASMTDTEIEAVRLPWAT